MKFKKILYSAGAIGALVTPTVSIIACSKNTKKPIKLNKNDVIVNSIKEKDINSKLTVNGVQEASKFSKPKTVLTDSGVLATFTWGEANDGLGTIKWKAVLSKGSSKKKTISGTLKGFKTKENNKVLRSPTLSLSELKGNAINEIDSIAIPTLDGTAHSPTKHAFILDAKKAAKQDINAAKTSALVASNLGNYKDLLKSAIKEYEESTGTVKALADAKDAAKTEINKITIPTLDGAAHSATKHTSIAAAKQAALQEIEKSIDIKKVDEVKAAQIAKIKSAIKEYEESTGTVKALAGAKDAAKTEINKITIPTLDGAAHSATKHASISAAKQSALQEIEKSIDIKKVDEVKAAQIAKIKNAIKEYEKSTGTVKALAGAKDAAKTEINKITIPTLDGAAHSATKHASIAAAKQAALQEIEKSIDIKKVDEVKAAQIAKIKSAIKEYEESTGTVKALAGAKDAAKTEINKITIPTLDGAAHSATKHASISAAKQSALQEIEKSIDIKKVDEVKVAQIAKIKNAIKEYEKSTGTVKALAGAKDAAKTEINKITIPTLDGAAHSATKHASIAAAKQAALQEIEKSIDIKKVDEVKAAQIAKIKNAIKEYEESTGTVKVLAGAKDAAKTEINKITIPTLDGAAHSATKHASIAAAKQAALQEIEKSIDIKKVDEVKAAQIAKIKNAIKEYEKSTGTVKALADAKDAAKTEINKITIPTLDGAAHSATKHASIAAAKQAALQEIEKSIDIKKVDEVKAAQIAKIKNAIKEYEKSTGTKVLADAKDAAKTEINKITIPTLDGAAHSATKHASIAAAKQAALQEIEKSIDIKKVDEVKAAQIAKIKNAIKEYEESTGTKALADAKNAAKIEINKITIPILDEATHSAVKHASIDSAKKNALRAIEGIVDIKKIDEIKVAQKDLLKKVINEYETSTGTNAILAKEKANAINEINAIDIPKKEDLVYEKSLYDNITKVKAASLQKIGALTYDKISTINKILKAEKVKINAALKKYLNSQPIVTYSKDKIMRSLSILKNKNDIMLYLLDLRGTTGKDGIASIKTDISELQVDELVNIDLSVSVYKGLNGKLKNGDILRLSASPKKWYKFAGTESPITIDIEISKLNSPSASIIDEQALIDYIKSIPVSKWGLLDDENLTKEVGNLYSTFPSDIKSLIKSKYNVVTKSKSIVRGIAKKLKHGDVIRITLGYNSGSRFRISGNSDVYIDITLGKKRVLTFKEKKIIDFIKNLPITNWGDLYEGKINHNIGELYKTFPDSLIEELKTKFNAVFKTKKIISGNPGHLKKGDVIRIIFGDEGNDKKDLGVDVTIK